MLTESGLQNEREADKLKRMVKKFKTLKRRVGDLKNTEVARAHKEIMIDSYDTIEIIEDLVLEMKDDAEFRPDNMGEDIQYYLSQLEENVHELERGQSLAL